MNNHMPGTSSSFGKAASIAVIIMALSNLFSRLLGFVRMMVLAHVAGMDASVDAYSFSFLLPDIINHILAGSALSITFIPVFQDIFTNKSEEDAWRFFSNVLTTGTIVFIIIIGISLVFTEQLLAFAGKNIRDPLNPEQYDLTVRLTRIIIPAQLFFFWGALLNGVQYAKKRFVLPALTPVFYNIGIICGGIFLYPYVKMAGFSWGVLIGAFLGNVVTQIPGALKAGMRYKPYLNIKDPKLIHWFVITIPFIVGLGMTFSNEALFRAFGSASTDGSGAVASLDYSYKAMMFLVGLFGQSFAAGIYPFLSQLAVEKKFGEMTRLIVNIIIKIASITIPLSIMMMFLSDNVIALLYQRGKFDTADTMRTARLFIYYLPGTFFMAGGQVVLRAYYSVKSTFLPLVITTATVLLCLPIFHYLNISLGSNGIAIASSIFMFLSFFSLIVTWDLVYKNKLLPSFTGTFFKIILVSLPSSALCYCIKKYVTPHVDEITPLVLKNILVLFAAGFPGVALMAFLLEVTGIVRVRQLLKQALKRGKK